MSIRTLVSVAALASTLGATGCIKEQQPASTPAASRSSEKQDVHGPADEPCVPPEISTGDPYTVGTTPCKGDNPDMTREPPDIHPNQ